MKICSNCNNYVDDNAAFCNNCGAQFVAQQYQPQIDYSQQYVENQQYSQGVYQQPAYQQETYQQQYQAPQQPVAKKKVKPLPIVIVAIALVLVVGVIALLIPKASKGLEFRSNGDGTCTWVGLGTCTDTEIIVPEKNGDEIVVAVGSDTVNFTVEHVTKIKLPDTIKTIEDNAFDRARSLQEIELNEGLETIGEDAFNGCSALEKIEFPSTLKSIGEWAFARCELLTEVELPEGFEELGKFSFSDCTAIKKISIPSTLNKLHFISEKGGNCGYEFDTTSVEEFTFAGDWKYTTLDMGMTDDGEFYFYGSLARDISNEEYPGTFYEITEKNNESVICALLNKTSIKVNGETCTMTKEKPVGKYVVPNYYGFVLEEFTEDGQLKVSYESWSEETSIKDLACANYTFDEESYVYSFSKSVNSMGSIITIEKAFLFFGDFILSVDYSKIDNDEDISLCKWVPYSALVKDIVEEDVEIDDDKLEDIVEKKDNLLEDLIAAFRAEGITVTVDKVSGEISIDSSVLFGGDSAVVTDTGKDFLNRFIRAYTSVVYNEKYDGFISKTIVEGHTAPVSGSTYESGLPLSEERANNVKNYCVSSEIQADTIKLAQSLEAVGLSNSKPVYNTSGAIDMAGSRRVTFRFVVNLD